MVSDYLKITIVTIIVIVFIVIAGFLTLQYMMHSGNTLTTPQHQTLYTVSPYPHNFLDLKYMEVMYSDYNKTHAIIYINLTLVNVGFKPVIVKDVVITSHNMSPIDVDKIRGCVIKPGDNYSNVIRVIIIDKNSSEIREWMPGEWIGVRFYYTVDNVTDWFERVTRIRT